MPKLSILVPIYNVEKYLSQCLESLINQTFEDIEIICINDGSKDSSFQILQKYRFKDKRIKVINKENTGYGHSMNIGMDVAAGEYIGIVEPDDFVKATMFENLYNLTDKYKADIVKSEYFCYTTKNNQTRKTGHFAKFKINKPVNLKNVPSLIRKPPSIWSAIYRREFLIKNNIRFLETPGASYQDTLFSFKTLCLAEKIILTPKAYLFYRQDSENSSINSKEKTFAICGEYDEITEFLNKKPEIKNFINTQKLIKQYRTYMWNLKRIDEKLQNGFIDKFSETFKKYFNMGEIDNVFCQKIDEKEFQMLIFNKEEFKKYIQKKLEKAELNDSRKKLFSVHINSSRISIVLFGKQIAGIG